MVISIKKNGLGHNIGHSLGWVGRSETQQIIDVGFRSSTQPTGNSYGLNYDQFQKNSGFTLIEIVSVLMLISILTAVLISRPMNNQAEIIGKREAIKSHIRYSQMMAMKSNTVWGIHFNGSTYTIFRNGSTADTITLPGIDGAEFSIPTALGTCNETIYFDLWGTPYTDLTLTQFRPTDTLGTLGITITADTGYVN